MASRKKIIFQAVGASIILGLVGVTFNVVTLTGAKREEPIVAYSIEEDYLPEVEARERAMEEHGEPLDEGAVGGDESGAFMGVDPIIRADRPPAAEMQPPDYERELRKNERRRIAALPRGEAIRRAEELHGVVDDPATPPEIKEEAERELGMVLEEHFPPAAGEPEPVMEPKNGDSHAAPLFGLDINNVFNKVWGLLQALVVAWATFKFQQRKKEKSVEEDWLTESKLERINEDLQARYRTDRIKQK